MSTNPKNALAALPIGAMLCSIADAAEKGDKGKPKIPDDLRSKLPPELVRLLEGEGCGDPGCEACSAGAGDKNGDMSRTVAHKIQIQPDIADLVGLKGVVDPASIDAQTRTMAAVFIQNIRERASQQVKPGLAESAKFAEQQVLLALNVFSTM